MPRDYSEGTGVAAGHVSGHPHARTLQTECSKEVSLSASAAGECRDGLKPVSRRVPLHCWRRDLNP